MTYLLLFCVSVSQLAAPVSTDPSSGYSTLLIFEDPEVITTELGSYPVFQGVPLRFVVGEPARPSLTLFIPLPEGAAPELRYSAASYRSTGISSRQAVTPAIIGEGLSAREIDADPVSPEDRHVVLNGIIPVAGTRMAMITVFPIAGESGSSYASRIDLQLRWDPVPGGISVERHPLLKLIAPKDCLFWRNSTDGTAESIFWGKPWARIAVGNTGGYTVSGYDLAGGGCEVIGSPSASLRLFTGPGLMFSDDPEDSHELSEVAFTVNDLDGDGLFDGDDSIEFFGRGLSRWEVSDQELLRLQHRYATHNVYWLTWGGENGRRMDGISGQPDSSPEWGNTILTDLWLREEHIWISKYEGTTGWIWEGVSEGETITVPFQVTGSGGSSVKVSVVTDKSQSHTVAVYINGNQVLTDTWYGSGGRTLEMDNLQLSGSCTLEIKLVEDVGDGILGLASLQVTYPDQPGDLTGRVLFPSRERMGRYNFSASGVSSDCSTYHISDFNSPKLITATEYAGGNLEFSYNVDTSSALILMDSGDWMSPDSIVSSTPGRLVGTVSDGDRLIIVHPSLYNGIWGIETLSTEQDYSPVVATTTEIYDEFGQGVADPGAIRSTVRWGIDNWSGGLSGVILTGDGHYDFLGHTTTQLVMIPPWIKLLTNNVCFDDMYVMVHENAFLPEVPIARIPVDNLSQLGTCTAKLLSYYSDQNSGTWMNRALIVADDEWGQGAAWNETGHTRNSELITEEVLPRSMSREKFYLIEYPWPPGPWTPDGPHPEKPEARESFIETFNQGFLFLLYQGHGAANQIAHEVMMLGEDVSSFINGHRLPVSFWATCDVGHFDNPGSDAIGETLVYHPAGGCISSVAATRGTFGEANYRYFRSVIDSLCRYQDLTVGDAIWQSKLALSGSYSLNNKYYVVFGYPDMPLPIPDLDGSVTMNDDTLWSGELNTISGNGFQSDGLAFIEVLESSWNTVYTCLGGSQISYIRYGGTAYNGTQIVEGGEFSIDCFIPVQSITGNMARGAALALSSQFTVSGAEDPAVLVEGTPSGGDLEGPSVNMWIRGYEGIQHPELTGDITLEAELSDSSGICLLGGYGKELNLFVDGNGNNVSSYFSYNRGSSVNGKLVYTLEAMSTGEHTLILWSVDGLGNGSMDTLDIRILEEVDLAVTEAVIYPNPGNGTRCFSFRISEDAQVTVSIFTVAGTRIEVLTQICTQGYNQILWNGLDHDGDPVATGPYIYKINAEALGTSVFSRTAEEFGILAVTKED